MKTYMKLFKTPCWYIQGFKTLWWYTCGFLQLIDDIHGAFWHRDDIHQTFLDYVIIYTEVLKQHEDIWAFLRYSDDGFTDAVMIYMWLFKIIYTMILCIYMSLFNTLWWYIQGFQVAVMRCMSLFKSLWWHTWGI